MNIKKSPVINDMRKMCCCANSFLVAREHNLKMVMGNIRELNKGHFWNIDMDGEIVDFSANDHCDDITEYEPTKIFSIDVFPEEYRMWSVEEVHQNELHIANFVMSQIRSS